MTSAPLATACLMFLGTLAFGACEARAADFQIERVPAGLIFDGAISPQSVAQLATTLRQRDTLLISSSSGDPISGLALGNLVLDREVTVAVNGECLNVCAAYVFLPAHKRQATLGYSVRFGSSPFLVEELVAQSWQGEAPAEARQASEVSDRYRSLLARAGVSLGILKCIDYAARSNLTARQRGQGFVAVALSRDVFAAFGIAVSGRYAWVVDEGFRQRFSALAHQRIMWVDKQGQCRPSRP